ncbi:riboflavin synthase [Selenomonas sputigena]|uniref:riboflavin synthase n=1 Tax=Selenomonas sputigena TaxID=69823 RepID=UPI0028E9A071|nr:riboflavin synthase [Selenomonas sputigena]
MFTGIIEEVGALERLAGGEIAIRAKKVLEDVALGDSIAVNGICLTVTHFDAAHFVADVMPETVRRTSLAELKRGSRVNLERALTLRSRLGGHIVSGHIDGVGTIAAMQEEGNAVLLTVRASTSILRYIVEKGSVALDGISLTVAHVGAADFTVSLIPHTREITNLREKRMGSRLNIETDILGKYVEKLFPGAHTRGESDAPKSADGITMDFLRQQGF